MQHPDGTAERGAVALRRYFAAFLADIVKKAYHSR
jgi:hypothetical protein